MAMFVVRARQTRKPVTVRGVQAQMRDQARIVNIALLAFVAVSVIGVGSVALSRENARVDAVNALEKGDAAEARGLISAEALCNTGVAPLAELLRQDRGARIEACIGGK